MPTIYKKKLFTDSEREHIADHVQTKLIQKQREDEQKFYQSRPNDNYYRVQNESKKAALHVFRQRLKLRSKI